MEEEPCISYVYALLSVYSLLSSCYVRGFSASSHFTLPASPEQGVPKYTPLFTPCLIHERTEI